MEQYADWIAPFNLPGEINRMNRDGWRLVHTLPSPGGAGKVLAVWERPTGSSALSTAALVWLASSPDEAVAAEATALITDALESPAAPEVSPPPTPAPPAGTPSWTPGGRGSSCGAAHEHRS